MSEIRVFVNGKGIDAPAGSTALAAVQAADHNEGEAVNTGERSITDSRGLPVDPTAAAFAGAIFRTIRAR